MSFCSSIYANVIGADGKAPFGSVFYREDDITVMNPCRRIDITIGFDDIMLGLHRVIALDVCNKLVEVHLVSACIGHKGPSRHFTRVYHKGDKSYKIQEKRIGRCWYAKKHGLLLDVCALVSY